MQFKKLPTNISTTYSTDIFCLSEALTVCAPYFGLFNVFKSVFQPRKMYLYIYIYIHTYMIRNVKLKQRKVI